MKLIGYVILSVGVIALAGLLACSPQNTPTTSPVTAPSPAQPAPSPLVAQALIPEDAAWNKIVEAAKREGRITFYSFNFTGDLGLALQQAFEKRYGIDLQIVTGRGAEFTERLKVEKRMGQPMGDATEGASGLINSMKLEGLTVGIGAELPALKEKGVWIIDPLSLDPKDKHLIAHFVSNYSPYVNNRLVKAGEEPQVWRDLANPRWKGKMAISNHIATSSPYQLWVPLIREKVIDVEYLQLLYKQELWYVATTVDGARQLARGDFSLLVVGTDSSTAVIVAEGAPIRATQMADGTPLSPGAAAAIGGAPHINAAKVFLNWLMSQEGQTVHGKAKSSNSVRSDVPDFRLDPIKFLPKRPVVITAEDNEEATRLFREKWIDKLMGK